MPHPPEASLIAQQPGTKAAGTAGGQRTRSPASRLTGGGRQERQEEVGRKHPLRPDPTGHPGTHPPGSARIPNKCAIDLTLAEVGFTQVQAGDVSYREPDGRLRVLEAVGFFHQWVGRFDSP